ncbi:hypothetical protein IGI04_009048 [Brassica rapa subsp. trilocularis]|uniref:Mitochondrial import receptor subunit TOM5 homolog n=1 Tax=Brassica rapa subsp. trilocularis TaxID=1813537 RepID=A0ABQ7MZI5_BRACM|nr:hypothetical protein IGI04_009048 [Brassica rapa subsp. trilocularis]
MAKSVISMDQLKALWHSEVHDERKWAANMVKSLAFLPLWKLVRALGVFAGGVFLMRNFGDLMAV